MAETLLITGPPGSGKTTRALQAYRQRIDAVGADAVLLLLPNQATVSDARLRLVADGIRGILNPQIFQFYALVERLLAANDEAGPDLSESLKRFLLQDIAESFCRSGELKHFSVSTPQGPEPTPGLARALSSLISELKQGAIEPDQFKQAVANRGLGQKDPELVAIYATYQQRIRAAGMYDAEGKLWRVRNLIQEGKLGPFTGTTDVIVDGFINFTPAQFDIVSALAARAERFTITLTQEESGRRPELFRTALDTLEQVRRGLGPKLKEEALPGSPTGVPGLDRLADTLFGAHFAHDFAGSAEGVVSITEAPGTQAEIETLARTVKDTIVRGGASPEDLAILTAGARDNARIEEVFGRAGVPVSFPAARPLESSGVARSLLCILRVLEGDASREAVLNLLQYGRLQPAAPEPDRIDQLCRMANVIHGRAEIEQGLADLARRHRLRLAASEAVLGDDPAEVSEAIARDAEAAVERIHWMFDRLASVPARAPIDQLSDAFDTLLHDIGFFHDADGETDRVVQILQEARLARRLIARGTEPYPLTSFISYLRSALAYQRAPRTSSCMNAVSVLPFTDARGLFFKRVYFPGMLEAQIPASISHCPFYPDTERRALSEAGMITLGERKRLQEEAMFSFYLAVTRARDEVHFSYAYVDADGKPQTPSHYLDEIARLLTAPDGRSMLSKARWPVGMAFPPYPLAARPEELAGRLATSLWTGVDSAQSTRLYNALPEFRRRTLVPLAIRAAVCHERDRSGPYGRWDGCLTDPRIQEVLAGQLQSRPMSASRLEEYIACPFSYFARNLLHLRATEEPTAEIQPAHVGGLVHDIAFEFYRQLRERMKRTTYTLEELEAVQSEMTAIYEKEFQRRLRSGEIRNGGLWQVRRRLLEELLKRFVQAQASTGEDGPVPSFFEVSFGFDVDRDPQDPASIPEPLVLDLGSMKLRIHGSIDRIDLLPDGGFRVLDYKTGKGPSSKSVQRGEKLQLPLYLLAAAQLIFADRPEAQVHSADFLPVHGSAEQMASRVQPSGRRKPAIHAGNWTTIQQTVRDQLQAVAAGLRAGAFSVAPNPNLSPCRYCEFRPICLFSENRHARKSK